VRFDAGPFGWVLLRTGSEAGAWAAPGVAQRLLDTIAAARLSHLGLHDLGRTSGVTAWGGPPAELSVADDSPHLQEIAKVLAALLTRPNHEVRAVSRSRTELAQRQARGNYALSLDFVRALGPTAHDALLSLLTAADRDLARRPPRVPSGDVRQIARTLPFGIVGALRISGAYAPGIRGIEEWNLASAAR
jgi:peptide/nickel transport system substrate-binding protein